MGQEPLKIIYIDAIETYARNYAAMDEEQYEKAYNKELDEKRDVEEVKVLWASIGSFLPWAQSHIVGSDLVLSTT